MNKFYIFVPNLKPIIIYKDSLRDAYMEMLKIYECEFSDIQITSKTNVSIFINVNFNGSPYRCSVCHHSVVNEEYLYEDWED